MTGLSLILIFLALLFFGIPIMIALGVAGVISCLVFDPVPIAMIMNTYFTAMVSFPLIAVPFFILAGVMMQGGISARLITFAVL